MSQLEALLDEGFHGRAALVGSLAFFYFGTEQRVGPGKNNPLVSILCWLIMIICCFGQSLLVD